MAAGLYVTGVAMPSLSAAVLLFRSVGRQLQRSRCGNRKDQHSLAAYAGMVSAFSAVLAAVAAALGGGKQPSSPAWWTRGAASTSDKLLLWLGCSWLDSWAASVQPPV